MKAVVIGAGRIGCGFVGHLLHRSGHDVCLVGRGPVVDPLKRDGGYVVRVTDGRTARDERVQGVRCLDVRQLAEVDNEISTADVVCTAVGTGALPDVASHLATGLAMATHPINVIAFENAEDAGPRLRRLVADAAGLHTASRHGFSGAVVSRVVAQRQLPERPGDPLLLIGEPNDDFTVDGEALKTPMLDIEGMIAVDDFAAHFRRKLYRYSAGHATAAYLGHLKGYRYLHAAVRDPEIRWAVRSAIVEGQRGLQAQYGAAVAGSPGDADQILRRFDNAALGDTVARVGRDVRRKLGHYERLIGAASLAERAGVAPVWLAHAAAAALFFHDAPPTGSRLDGALWEITGLQQTSPLARRIEEAWLGFSDGWGQGNLLLSLEQRLWSWSGRPTAQLVGLR